MIVSSNTWTMSRMSATPSSSSSLPSSGSGPMQGPRPKGPPPAASEGMSMSDETLAGLVGVQQAQGEGFTPPSFDDIDADGDGGISQTEMQSFGQSVHGDASTETADGLFAAMDADGDGTVTTEEKTAFDDSRAAGRAPPPGEPASTASASESSESDAASKLAALMQELMTALEAYTGTAEAETETTGTTTSVAA